MIETPSLKSAKTRHLFDAHKVTLCGIRHKHPKFLDQHTTIFLKDCDCSKCKKTYWRVRNADYTQTRHIDDRDVEIDWTDEGFQPNDKLGDGSKDHKVGKARGRAGKATGRAT